jgi:hypothetical protein
MRPGRAGQSELPGSRAGRGQILAERHKADEVLGDAFRNALAGEEDHGAIDRHDDHLAAGRARDAAPFSAPRKARGADGIWPLMNFFPRLATQGV